MKSKSENILQALFAVLQTIEGLEVQRNTAVPVAIPESSLLILRDGEFGEPESSLGGFADYYFTHKAELEVYVQESDQLLRDTQSDEILQKVYAALTSDLTLGGLVLGMEITRDTARLEPIEGAEAIKFISLNITLEYQSNTSI